MNASETFQNDIKERRKKININHILYIRNSMVLCSWFRQCSSPQSKPCLQLIAWLTVSVLFTNVVLLFVHQQCPLW
uniref:Uncharacterized protein n=1 Tax=Anguilla anguilla TaxID=7936 RepID=A0A0E9WXY8_ANGAN